MNRLPADHLPPLLRAQARGYYPAEAAVELLIAHGSWFRRTEFLNRCILQVPDAPDGPRAWIDWVDVVEFLAAGVGCSSSEEKILRLAAELAGEDTSTPLPELLTGLDDHNRQLVLQAVSHAMGIRPPHLRTDPEVGWQGYCLSCEWRGPWRGDDTSAAVEDARQHTADKGLPGHSANVTQVPRPPDSCDGQDDDHQGDAEPGSDQ